MEATLRCARAGHTDGGTRSCRLTRHLVATELKLALDVRLPVLAHLIIALRTRGFVCAYVPFETARCLLTRSTPEGELGLGTLHDLGDRAVKEPANERAAEKVYDFLLFGREVYLLERAGDLVATDPLNRVLARLHGKA
jgi:hypothetical protein